MMLLMCGCQTTHITNADIDVYRDSNKPSRSYKEICLLTREGKAEDQGKIEEEFKVKAAQKHGKALIIYPKEVSGVRFEPFWVAKHSLFSFKAAVITYEQ